MSRSPVVCLFSGFAGYVPARAWTRALAAGALLAALAAPGQALAVPPMPTVTGPIDGPGPLYTGLIQLAPGTYPEDYGYVASEYFVSGTANGQPYKTRILVRSPANAASFSGIVVTESLHSNGTSVTFSPMRYGFTQRGHVHVDIAAQQANITSAKAFNPVRYASLNIAAGAQTSQIMAQVALLIKSNLPDGPLAPLVARRLIMEGTSQASGVLRTYQSQMHVQERMPDGSALVDGYLTTSTLGNAPMMVVDVPTVHMPTQTEVNTAAAAGAPFRRPDSDDPANRYRLYEFSPMAHANSRDTPAYVPNQCTLPISDFPWGAAVAVGLYHLVNWVDLGTPPPHAPSNIQIDNNLAGDDSRLALDAFGNPTGGVRTPYVDVPAAAYRVPQAGNTAADNFLCSLASSRVPLSRATLRSLYPSKAAYVSMVTQRLDELISQGWWLPEYRQDVIDDAHGAYAGTPVAFDFNGDVKGDILWRNANGALQLWTMNGATRVSSVDLPAEANTWSVAGTGDFDGDGKMDILLRKPDGILTLWLMNGGAVTPTPDLPVLDSAWSVAGLGDFDGDGKADILLRRGSDGANIVWLMNGSTVALMADLPNAGSNKLTSVGAVADFDGDGKADILFRNRDGANTLWLMNGTTVGSMVPVPTLAAGWALAGVADFDGDGKADILLRKISDGSNAVWLMNGASIAASGFLPSLESSSRFVATADYDGDGRADILVRMPDGSDAIWFMNGTAARSMDPTVSLPPSWQAVSK